MKYGVIIMGGGADHPQKDLGGHTPLEGAALPHLAKLSARGRVGLAATTSEGESAGTVAACQSILGYDPARYELGAAWLEAIGAGMELTRGKCVFHLDLVTQGSGELEGVVIDSTAGGITKQESGVLFAELLRFWKERSPWVRERFSVVSLSPGHALLIDSSDRLDEKVLTTPPSGTVGAAWAMYLPEGAFFAKDLRHLVELSGEFLGQHELNVARCEAGLRPANLAWISGQAGPLDVPSFRDRYGLSGAMVTAVARCGSEATVVAGLGKAIGWSRVDAREAGTRNELLTLGDAAAAALRRHDLVCCYVSGPAEWSIYREPREKVKALEAIDRDVVGPVLAELEEFGDPELEAGAAGWRLLVMPDLVHRSDTGVREPAPVPFVMAGGWVRSTVVRPFTERGAMESDLYVDPGHELMEYFLRSGLRAPKSARKR